MSLRDIRHIQAAEGWLGLGDHLEAKEELKNISATYRKHPAVLMLRCMVHYNAKNWPMVFEIADTLTTIAPNNPFGWLQRSHALHFMGQTDKAWKGLLPVAKRFNLFCSVSYDLACYAAVLGKLEEARLYLHRAFAVAEKPTELKLHALEDPDLKNLWVPTPQ